MALRVLTWNLMHGRAMPPAGRSLLAEFAGALADWRWDVALLQEVPPWWPTPLASAAGGADARWVLTSRNFGLALRRAVAVRRPDLIKSNGGGCNAILVRGVVAEHRTRRLCRWPERRWLHAARVSTDGGSVWTGNLHCTVRNPSAALREGRLAAAVMRSWAGEAPVVLGGDFNERGLALDGYRCLANHDVDYVFGSGGLTGCAAELLNRGRLSDHAPVAVTVEV